MQFVIVLRGTDKCLTADGSFERLCPSTLTFDNPSIADFFTTETSEVLPLQ